MINYSNPDTDQCNYHHPCGFTKNTQGLVSPNATIDEVGTKLLSMGGYGIYVVDFIKDNLFLGCIGRAEFEKALSKLNMLDSLTAVDIANKKCRTATLQTLDNDIKDLIKYRYLPVVDSRRQFQFYLTDQSNWSHWSNIDQGSELAFWRSFLTKRYPTEGIPRLTVDRICVNDEGIKKSLIRRLSGTVIEIGAGPFAGFLWSIQEAAHRVIIEPLANEYAILRKEFFVEILDIEGVLMYPQGADIFIPELVESADVILCHNALDHTPDWPFALGNIARYTKKGGMVYIGTDIDHHASSMLGHYNITYNPDRFYKLLEAFGFDIQYKHCYSRTIGNSFVAVVCIKK